MRVFVPVEDESVGSSSGLLVPYRFGLPCEHALRETPQWTCPVVQAPVDGQHAAAPASGAKAAPAGVR